MKVADSGSLDITNRITLEAWIYRTKVNSWQGIVGKFYGKSKSPGSDGQRSYMMYVTNTNLLAMIISNNGGQQSVGGDHFYAFSTTMVPINTWTHVACTFDGDIIKLYINGNLETPSLQVQPSTTQTIFSGNSPVYIGTFVQTTYPQSQLSFGGTIDDIAIYDRALTQTEIQLIYNFNNYDKFNGLIVSIDIKPGSSPNSINLGSQGTVPVAILSTSNFDATTVNPATVSLAGADVGLRGKSNKYMASIEDINEDGLDDLIVHIETELLELTEGTTKATLEGYTLDGVPIIGMDSVNIVPP